jgi:hypothetical protein
MNSSHEDELEEVDKVLSRAVPSKEKSISSIDEIVNDLANSTTLDECVICLDGESEGPLIKNELCDCVFVYHSKCYFEWIKNSRRNTCILCKKPIIYANNSITNIRVLDILDNNYKQSQRNIRENMLEIINRPIPERRNTGNKIVDCIYNYDLHKMELVLYVFLVIWIFFMIFILLTVM